MESIFNSGIESKSGQYPVDCNYETIHEQYGIPNRKFCKWLHRRRIARA
jgi:hypothetical protein